MRITLIKCCWGKNCSINRRDVALFTRPQRFGKTLNMSMLKYFFENMGNEQKEGGFGSDLFAAGDVSCRNTRNPYFSLP